MTLHVSDQNVTPCSCDNQRHGRHDNTHKENQSQRRKHPNLHAAIRHFLFSQNTNVMKFQRFVGTNDAKPLHVTSHLERQQHLGDTSTIRQHQKHPIQYIIQATFRGTSQQPRPSATSSSHIRGQPADEDECLQHNGQGNSASNHLQT